MLVYCLSSVVAVLICAGTGLAQLATYPPPHYYMLDNGLRVVLLRDDNVETVTVNLTYLVGAAQDGLGLCGRAHLLEHMMFRGSKHAASGEFGRWIERAGGELQGSTGLDRTVFYETVPASVLPLVLYLESDRMRDARMDPDDFEAERTTLLAEVASKSGKDLERIRNEAAGLLNDRHGSVCPVAGVASDIARLTLKDVRAFYSTFYTPRNAVLIIAGHINLESARKMVAKYFGDISTGSGAEDGRCDIERATTEKASSLLIFTVTARRPAVYVFFDLGTTFSKQWFATLILGQIVADGTESVLGKNLALKSRPVGSIRFAVQPRKEQSLGMLAIQVQRQDALTEVRDDILAFMKEDGDLHIDEALLLRKAGRVRTELEDMWDSTSGEADTLSQSYALTCGRIDFNVAFSQLMSASRIDVLNAWRLVRAAPVKLASLDLTR